MRKHDAKTPSTNPEDKDMTSPEHRKQRQTNALENKDQVPLALNFEQMREDINMDIGGNDEEHSLNSCMCTEITVVGEQIMDYTHSPIPTTITATNQSKGEFTPVLNGSSNRQSSLERRNRKYNNNNNNNNNSQ
jgi:hypothetical protein